MSIWAHISSFLFRRSSVHDEVREEIQTHLALRADDLQRTGLPRAKAERQARIEFGAHVRWSEECHEELIRHSFDIALQDIRVSLRALRKSPSFAAAAVITLALAIGVNAVVFGVFNGLILRPLNVPSAQTLWGTEYGSNPEWQSYPNYLDLKARNRSFEDLAMFTFAFVGLQTEKTATQATGYGTSGNYFDVLAVTPYLGRFFHAGEEHGADSAPVLVLTYAYWEARFHSDRGVIGKTVLLNSHPFTVIGVSQPEFRGTLLFVSPDFFVPVVNQTMLGGGAGVLSNRTKSDTIFEVFGHLKSGTSVAQARADIDRIGSELQWLYPREVAHKPTQLALQGLTSFGGAAKGFLAALLVLAGCILLAACANLGGLFGARAVDRSREVALRLALGSSRRRILCGLLTEAILLAMTGGFLGLLGSVCLLRRLSVWQPFAGAPIHLPVTADSTVYIAAILLAIVSGFLFGSVPVRPVLRSDPYDVVKAGSRITGGRSVTSRELLLAGQIAICAVLITCSLVAVRGLMRSMHGQYGFEPRHTLCIGFNLKMAGYADTQARDLEKRILQATSSIPGVQAVGLVNDYPPLVYTSASRINLFTGEAVDLRPTKYAARPYLFDVSSDYFRAAGTALLAGREFTTHDDEDHPRVAIVNRFLARSLFGSEANSLGQFVKLPEGMRVQIVGIVEDGKYLSLTEDQDKALFLPVLQRPLAPAYLIVRSQENEATLANAVRLRFRGIEPGLPISTETWQGLLSVVQFPASMATVSLGVLGLLGSILSITGIAGMASYQVSRRFRELGIRSALGAQKRQLLGTALGRALRVLAVGSVIGLVLGLLAGRVLAAIVYQATPRDPLVLLGLLCSMLALGLLATWVPAQRVLSLNPTLLLREE